MKKRIALILAVVLLVCVAVGATIAWLTDKTEQVTNIFTAGTIDVDLVETKEDFKMIPGWTIEKDPVASVPAGSEDAYLFVKVESNKTITEANGVYSVGDYLEYEIADGWTKLEEGVYYRVVKAADTDRAFPVLKDNQVKVKDTVTKAMMDAIIDGTVDEPTLSFTAYASQLYKSQGIEFTAAQAWANIT